MLEQKVARILMSWSWSTQRAYSPEAIAAALEQTEHPEHAKRLAAITPQV
jgi:hypothetical protein